MAGTALAAFSLSSRTESERWRRVRSAHGSGDCTSAATGGQAVHESRLEPARLLLGVDVPSASASPQRNAAGHDTAGTPAPCAMRKETKPTTPAWTTPDRAGSGGFLR
ncbi:hypothetical protein GCM10027073_53700 [Streptomyces chlorus]